MKFSYIMNSDSFTFSVIKQRPTIQSSCRFYHSFSSLCALFARKQWTCVVQIILSKIVQHQTNYNVRRLMKCKSKLVFHSMHYQCYPHNVGVVLCILRAANYKILRLFVHLWNMLMHSSIHLFINHLDKWSNRLLLSIKFCERYARALWIHRKSEFFWISLIILHTNTHICVQ